MKVIIHAGMNKTGSSSIQRVFDGFETQNFQYAEWLKPNHSELYALLFHPSPHQHPLVKMRGLPSEDIFKLRQKYRRILKRQLKTPGLKTFVFSAENISTTSISEEQKIISLERMRSFFEQYTKNISVIAYVRPPISFMQSAFQQRLKGSNYNLTLERLWPDYQHRFECIDQVFGKDRVELKIFHRDALEDGDVVVDFAKSFNLDVPAEISDAGKNESISLEALSLLFMQRTRGSGAFKGTYVDRQKNKAIVSVLSNIGYEKLRFSESLVAPIIEKFSEDISWIENRLGASILDLPMDGEHQISSEKDLLRIANENSQAVANKVKNFGQTASSSLLENLEALKELSGRKSLQTHLE